MLPIGCGIEWYMELNPAAAEWKGSLAEAAMAEADAAVTDGTEEDDGLETATGPGVDGESAPPVAADREVAWPADGGCVPPPPPLSPLRVVVGAAPPPPLTLPPPALTALSTDGGPPVPPPPAPPLLPALPGSRF